MQNITHVEETFENLVQEAWAKGIQGWDWSYLEGRWATEPLPWDYPSRARQRITAASRMLDIGTGGGELLSTLGPFLSGSLATEAYPPSVGLAGRTLAPWGVQVVQTADDVSIPLPVASESLDLVLNRHAGYSPAELFRILRPGGRFLTQQVGGKNQFRLNELFQNQPYFMYAYWTLDYALDALEKAGFTILEQREAHPATRFLDIGAVVYFLKIIDWQVTGFSVEKDLDTLRHVHEAIQREGCLTTWGHNFLIEAVKLE
jgi:SAM-dependent methyltransferase